MINIVVLDIQVLHIAFLKQLAHLYTCTFIHKQASSPLIPLLTFLELFHVVMANLFQLNCLNHLEGLNLLIHSLFVDFEHASGRYPSCSGNGGGAVKVSDVIEQVLEVFLSTRTNSLGLLNDSVFSFVNHLQQVVFELLKERVSALEYAFHLSFLLSEQLLFLADVVFLQLLYFFLY